MARPVRVMSALPTVKVMPPVEAKPRPHTKMTAAMMRLRDLVRSTLFSTTLRTPTAEIIPYSTKLTPPTMAVGMELTSASNLGEKLRMMAYSAARRMTRGSYTRLSASTPVFSP